MVTLHLYYMALPMCSVVKVRTMSRDRTVDLENGCDRTRE